MLHPKHPANGKYYLFLREWQQCAQRAVNVRPMRSRHMFPSTARSPCRPNIDAVVTGEKNCKYRQMHKRVAEDNYADSKQGKRIRAPAQRVDPVGQILTPWSLGTTIAHTQRTLQQRTQMTLIGPYNSTLRQTLRGTHKSMFHNKSSPPGTSGAQNLTANTSDDAQYKNKAQCRLKHDFDYKSGDHT